MKFYKLLFKLAIKSRWTVLWSQFYRKLVQFKYKKKYPLVAKRKVSNESDYEYFLRTQNTCSYLSWKKDNWSQLWDVISLPQFVQCQVNRLNQGLPQEDKPLDCDDFSVYFANIISDKYNPKLLTVTYKTKDKFKFGGHVVCLVTDRDGNYYHLSNWGLYGPYKSTAEVINSIVGDREYIGHAQYDPDLNWKTVKVFTDKLSL